MNIIKFYRVSEEYGFFSNFSPHKIVVQGEVWPTVEHFFQASKFLDTNIIDKIKNLSSPMAAAQEGRNRHNPIRDDWEEVKISVMKKGLSCKFIQHPSLRKALLQTQEATLVEHTQNDKFWADGGDGQGMNMLGKLLMEIREDLKRINNNPDILLPPWVAYSRIDPDDLFWRMGMGEDYLENWHMFLNEIGEDAYYALFPLPAEWTDYV